MHTHLSLGFFSLFLGRASPLLATAQVNLTLEGHSELTPDAEADRTTNTVVTLKNAADADPATKMTIEVHLQSEVALLCHATSPGHYADGTWKIDALDAGEEEQLHLTIALQSTTPRIVTAQLRSVAQRDPSGAIERIRLPPTEKHPCARTFPPPRDLLTVLPKRQFLP